MYIPNCCYAVFKELPMRSSKIYFLTVEDSHTSELQLKTVDISGSYHRTFKGKIFCATPGYKGPKLMQEQSSDAEYEKGLV